MLESILKARYQWCTILFYRNLFSVVPRKQIKEVSRLLKEIYAQECKASALKKSKISVWKSLGYEAFFSGKTIEKRHWRDTHLRGLSPQHWTKLYTNSILERLNLKIHTVGLKSSMLFEMDKVLWCWFVHDYAKLSFLNGAADAIWICIIFENISSKNNQWISLLTA